VTSGIAPGYFLAPGRLADSLPLTALTVTRSDSAMATGARRRNADTAMIARHGDAAGRYADLFGSSRGVVMKACQLLSLASLPAVGSPERRAAYQSVLACRADETPAMPAGLAADLAETELGLPLHEVYTDFDPHPIATTAIGQVHRASLQDGREVAVKIQYPGVERAIRADLSDKRALDSFLRFGCGMTCVESDVDAIASELSARIAEEIDYRIEAANQDAFAAAYSEHPLIRIPETVPEFCTARVLTMDLSDGLGWAHARSAPRRLRDRWGEVIYRFAAGSLTRLGMINADPNPGNYLFHPDGSVTFLDFGCVRRYSPRQIRTIQTIMRAIADSDAALMLDAMTEAGYVNTDDPPDADALLAWLRAAHTPVTSPQPYTYSPEFAARLRGPDLARAGEFGDVIKRLTIPADFLSIVRVNLGVTAVLAGLRSTGDWASIHREYSGGRCRLAACGARRAPC
jgi:predicted unusual protein kinase regulating ubiquinone biosynthesis (AarF/ABC1/UbiB family)